MTQFKSTLFKIEPGEGTAVGLSVLQAFFIGLPRLFTLTVGGALFLDHFSADILPVVYVAASVVLPAAGFLHLALERRLSFVRLQLVTLLALATVTGGFLVLLRVTDASWPAFALFIWCGAELHLSNIVLWSTANRVFTVREGKRLFGLIGTGEVVAAIIGGALAPVLVRFLGTANLLALSVIGFLLALANLVAMTRMCRPRLARDPSERTGDRSRRDVRLPILFRSRYLRLIFLCYAIVLSAGFFVNNIFYFQLGETFGSAEELAGFLGQFVAVFSFSALLFRSFLSGRLMLRLGLLGALVATPLVVLVAAMTVVVMGLFGAAAGLVFWTVVAMRYGERLLMGSLGQPAYYTLYQPLSRERRARVQTTAEIITGPIAGGVTGVVLLVLTKGFGLSSVGLSVALVPMLVVWMLVDVRAAAGFRGALTSALKRRGISGADLAVGDPTSLQILERGLESARPAEVLYCLRLLEEAGHPGFMTLVERVMDHRDPEVRCGAFQVVERSLDPGWRPLLDSRLAAEDDGMARAALLRALGASGGDEVADLVQSHLRSDDEKVRRGALVAMIRYCGDEATRIATEEIASLSSAADPRTRVFAASVIAEVGDASLDPWLRQLLGDPDRQVREAALAAARTAVDQDLWLLVVESLDDPALRAPAIRSLLSSGDAPATAMDANLVSGDCSPRRRRLIAQILGRLASERAVQMLEVQLETADRSLLSEVLWSLHLCDYQPTARARRQVETCLEREVEHGRQVLQARHDIAGQPRSDLLAAALGDEVERSRKRVFVLLSFLYDADTMMKIWSNFGPSQAMRDLGLELLEARIDRRHAVLTMPLLAGGVDASGATVRDIERSVVLDPPPWASPWIRACAAEAFLSGGERFSVDELDALLLAAEPMLREVIVGMPPASAASGSQPVSSTTVQKVRILRGISIFREIDDETLAELAGSVRELHLQRGERVADGDDGGRAMYIIVTGAVRLELAGQALAELGEGEIFGELSALDAGVRSESAVAIDACRLFKLDGDDLGAFMATRIEVVRGIIAVLCHRVRVAPTDKLRDRQKPCDEERQSISVSFDRDDHLSSLEKVLILKTAQIFSEVADEILAEVAARSQEVRLRKGEVLFHKGDPGTTTYIVAAGRIRIHIGEQWIADAGERAVVGELAALSSEPRTASVTAAEDSVLLALDQESLFELMWDQYDIVRGIIRVLVDRLVRLRGAVQVEEKENA